MACSIIICQALDHQLVPGYTSPRSLHSVQIATVRVQLATYARNDGRWQQFEADWMAGHVAAELFCAAPGDLVLVADHDTVERFSSDDRLIRAEYSGSEKKLPETVERSLAEEGAALEELLAWFWMNSLELPPAGFLSLLGVLERGGSMEFRWKTIRGRRDYKQAIEWLGVLDPDYRDDPEYLFAQSLVVAQESVDVGDHQRLQQWLESVDLTDAALFQGFCQRALSRTAS